MEVVLRGMEHLGKLLIQTVAYGPYTPIKASY